MAEKLDEVCDRTYICHPWFKRSFFLDQKAIFTTGFTIGNSYVQDRIKLAKEREEEKLKLERDPMTEYLEKLRDELKIDNIEMNWSPYMMVEQRWEITCEKMIAHERFKTRHYVDMYLLRRSSCPPEKYFNSLRERIIYEFNKKEKEEMNRIMDASNVKVTIGNRVYTPGSVQINSEPQLFGSSEITYTIEVDTIRDYCERAVPLTDYSQFNNKRRIPEIKKVHFNDPATVVLWADGTKTVVKCENEEFDPEKGLAMAIAKKALGNQGNYFETFKKHKKDYVPKKRGLNFSITNKPVEFEAVIENFDYEQFKRMGLLGTTKDGAKIYINQKPDNEDYKLEPNGDDE